MLRYPKVLFFSKNASELAVLEELLSEHVDLTPVSSIAELKPCLEESDYDALFCSWDARNEAIDEIKSSHPELPVVVLSEAADSREWAQVLEAGAFDMLVPPYDGRVVLAILEQASVSGSADGSKNNGARVSVVA